MSVRHRSKLIGLEHPLRGADGAAIRGARLMRSNVMDSNSQMSGSSSTTNTAGIRHGAIVASARRCAILPALRIAEDHAKDTASAPPRLIQQNGTVQLAQLSGDEQAEARAALGTGKERLEDAICRLALDARSAICDLQIRPITRGEPTELDFDFDSVASLAVLDRIVAKVPNDLMQMARIEAHLEVVRAGLYPYGSARDLHGLAELGQEFL